MLPADMMSTDAQLPGPSFAAREGHLVQFYTSEKYIVEAMAEFVQLGLLRGEGVLVVATAEHCRGMALELQRNLPELQNYIDKRQLVFANAHDCIDRIMEGVQPNRDNFINLLTPIIGELKQKFRRVRVYGELVNVLCSEKHFAGALTLETYWNGLFAADPDVALMGGYNLAHRSAEKQLRQQTEICLASAQEITDPLAIIKLSVDQLNSLLASGETRAMSVEQLAQKIKVIDNATIRITKSLRNLVNSVKSEANLGSLDF